MTISMLNVEYSKRRCSSLWHRVSACQSGCILEWILVCSLFIVCIIVPSVLWRCWLGGRKGILPVKNWVVGCWHVYLSGARCRLAYGPADATATPVLTHSCVSKVQIGCTFLVPAHLGSPGKRAVKRVCVCVAESCCKRRHAFCYLGMVNEAALSKQVYTLMITWP